MKDYYVVKVFRDKDYEVISRHATYVGACCERDRLNREDNRKGHYHYEVR
jgi:hypothetical protein